ncbi:amidase signature enzyme [Coccomyxa subellipsoidea C-169]|uniref:Amidase signature enzyme n=1 Tax=Coccomyxa subellipsoidea (strain C-169) TaxID=574566 RepID=I0YS78_COCSC|nr:amidase signature enzyme [Coccomyxa subellipsoidea C-169]EIE21247.1 amidase signature enzyme [Coccomyxa subellipsoidea C-169]|eukprot:XP_005645791.1 amidase signature enzyme [Coccomyxa subellipsoidea C-169]
MFSETAVNMSLTDLSAAQAVEMLCARDITAVQYASALLAKAQEWECINAWAEIDPAKVLMDAHQVDMMYDNGTDIRPLCGLTFAVKDLFDVAGYTTVAGTPALAGTPPQENNTALVQRLLSAHGVVMGKTRMHELAYGVTSINPVFGPVLNPYDVTKIPGGSSGGTGVALAARFVAGGFCTDTGGSCRVPASFNGVAGLRPTKGCYANDDLIVPLSSTRDTPGVMARTTADITLFNSIFSSCNTTAVNVSLSGMRIGYPVNWWADLSTETVGVYNRTLEAIKSAGVTLVPFNASSIVQYHDKYIGDSTFYTMELGRELSRYMWRHGYNTSFYQLAQQMASPATQATVLSTIIAKNATAFPTIDDYFKILTTYKPALQQQYLDLYNNNTVDIMIMPTTPSTAPPIYSVEPYMLYNGKYVSNRVAIRRTAIIEATVGAPGLSIPMGLADNSMPVGIQIQSRPGSDNLLLAVGEAIEALLRPTPPPPPPTCTGCEPIAGTQKATYNGTGMPQNGQTTSVYTLDFQGNCTVKSSLANALPLMAQSAAGSA